MSPWIGVLGTAIGTIVGVGTLGLEVYKLRHEQKQTKTLMQMQNTAKLQRSYTSISMCLEEISRFYNDKKSDAADSDDLVPISKLREEVAAEWAKRKGLSAKMQPRDRQVSKCRQKCKKFFEMAYDFLDKNAIDEKIFREYLYANSGNFLDLVEPLDEANFSVNYSHVGKYFEGENRPAIYKKIEEARKHPDTKNCF